jgi:hypothetical protein
MIKFNYTTEKEGFRFVFHKEPDFDSSVLVEAQYFNEETSNSAAIFISKCQDQYCYKMISNNNTESGLYNDLFQKDLNLSSKEVLSKKDFMLEIYNYLRNITL